MKLAVSVRVFVTIFLLNILVIPGVYASDSIDSGEKHSHNLSKDKNHKIASSSAIKKIDSGKKHSRRSSKVKNHKVASSSASKKNDSGKKHSHHSRKEKNHKAISSSASEVIAFGPKNYQRLKGKPQNEVTSFLTQKPGAGYTLKVFNGKGKHSRVTSAVVALNGINLFGSRDFDKNVKYLEKEITLSATNELSVELRGKHSSGFTLVIAGNGRIEENLAPVIISNPVTTATEDVAYQYDVEATDPNTNNSLIYQLVEAPTGMVMDATTGLIQWTPVNSNVGVHSVTVKATDEDDLSDNQSFSLTVINTNDAPMAANDDYTTNEDETLIINATQGLLVNDTDEDGDSLTASVSSSPSQGVVVLNSDGSFSYTPNANYYGADSFTYVASDGTTQSNIATVSITVANVNDAPSANSDIYSVDEDQTLTISTNNGVLANDTDIDGDALTAILDMAPLNGIVSLTTDGSLTYIPNTNYHGEDSFTYRATDGSVQSDITTVTITVNSILDPLPIVKLTIDPLQITTGDSSTLSWSVDTATTVSISPGIGAVTLNGALSVLPTQTTTYILTATGIDGATTEQVTVTVLAPPPTVTFTATPEQITAGETATLSWDVVDATEVSITPDIGIVASAGSTTVTPQQTMSYTLTANGEGGSNNQQITIQVQSGIPLPPDPTTVAPPLKATEITSFIDANAFLYAGTNPIQQGVDPTIMEAKRIAIIRGKVLDRSNNPLPGIKISIHNHPEYGETLSRADGLFDMAVNGGGLLTINYEATGYLPVQRQVQTPWKDYDFADDVVMIPLDSQVTKVDLSSATGMQVARGSVQNDTDGSRQATILFPQGTSATMTLPDGTTQPLSSLNVRATEYTVGDNGFEAMPGVLPPTSAYTYAVELSVDEAIAVNAKRVEFSQPLPLYVDNFLNFPVGEAVPTGYYDREKSAWVASDNGRVIAILAIVDGLAQLDVDGSGSPADTTQLAQLGITDAERAKLASIYAVGKSLWRSPISHFTPWDCNWPYGMPETAKTLAQMLVEKAKVLSSERATESCTEDKKSGCIISAQGQTLGELIPIIGTPFKLHYQSDRMAGFKVDRTIDIPLSGDSLPDSLESIKLTIDIAGRSIQEIFEPLPNQKYTFEWDGLDGYGRRVQGSARADVIVSLIYPCVYRPGDNGFAEFGSSAEPIGTRSNCQSMTLPRRSVHMLRSPFQPSAKHSGHWSPDIHHSLDLTNNRLNSGDGSFRKLDFSIQTVAGNGQDGFSGDGAAATKAELSRPWSATTDPVGNFYISDDLTNRIRRVTPDGVITTVAGNGDYGFNGDGGLAIESQLNYPAGIIMDNENNLYIADTWNHRIRRVSSDGIITTVAGNGVQSFSGDGGPATEASLSAPHFIALDPAGNFYIADSYNHRIRRVTPDGIITTVVGNGVQGFSGDDGLAIEASLGYPSGLAIDEGGNLYFTDGGNHRIRRVSTDGMITTVAGIGVQGFSGDGGPAINASLGSPVGINIDSAGNLYIAEASNNRIRRVTSDGIITTIAGNGLGEFSGDGGSATASQLNHPTDVAMDASGNLYIVDSWNRRIRRFQTSELFHADGYSIASTDGSQQFIFNGGGRHLRTMDTLTGVMLYEFGYDIQGLLVSVTDRDGNITTLERDTSGEVIAIVAPDGQRTELTLDMSGYLSSVTNPAGESYQMEYTADGLMTKFQDRKGNQNLFEYDVVGRLIKDTNAEGGGWTLSRTELASGYQTTMTSGEGRMSTFSVEPQSNGDRLQVTTRANGTVQKTLRKTNGETVTTQANGTQITSKVGPDPRFGMQSPIITEMTVQSPSELQRLTITISRDVQLSDLTDPLSLTQQTTTMVVNGKTVTQVYDATARTFTTTTPEGRTSTQALDAKGRIISIATPGLETSYLSYDARGRLQSLIQGSGADERVNTITYDGLGNIASVINPLGETTSFDYDAVGRVLNQVKPDDTNIGFGYDANGNTTGITPPDKPKHTFAYDGVNLATDYTAPDIGLTSHSTVNSYDLDKKLTLVDRPDDQAIVFNHDSTTGQLTSMKSSRGTTTYGYDQTTGQLINITAPGNEQLGYQYDGALPIKKAWAGTISGEVAFGYNKDFRLSSMTVADDVINYGYDNDGLLTQAGDLTLTYHAQNGLLEGSALDNLESSQSYNSFGELSGFDAMYSTTSLFNTSYTRDKLGRIVSKSETVDGATHTYGYRYDVVGRLVKVTKDTVVTDTFTYDANGNRLSHNATQATYNAQDRLVAYGGAVYSYTANGELTSKTIGGVTTQYVYDELGNLTQVTMPDNTAIDYVIDGRNRRIGKKVGDQLVQGFLYRDQLNPVAELDGQGNVVSRFIYAEKGHVPSYMVKNGTSYRIVSDHLGSVRLVVNSATGAIVQEMDYDVFGQVVLDTNPGFQPFGFAGGIYDLHTGLTRFGVRDYDAESGRWTAKDPIGFNGGDSNVYAYVYSNPVRYIDPTGEVGLLGSAVGGLLGVGSSLLGSVTTGGVESLTSVDTWVSAIGSGVFGAASGFAGDITGGMRQAIIKNMAIGGITNFAGQTAGLRTDGNSCNDSDYNYGSLLGSMFGGGMTSLITRGASIPSMTIGWQISTASTAVGTELGR